MSTGSNPLVYIGAYLLTGDRTNSGEPEPLFDFFGHCERLSAVLHGHGDGDCCACAFGGGALDVDDESGKECGCKRPCKVAEHEDEGDLRDWLGGGQGSGGDGRTSAAAMIHTLAR
jgi:hypothetical protein